MSERDVLTACCWSGKHQRMDVSVNLHVSLACCLCSSLTHLHANVHETAKNKCEQGLSKCQRLQMWAWAPFFAAREESEKRLPRAGLKLTMH